MLKRGDFGMNIKIQKNLHCIINLVLVVLWVIMMFFPEYIYTMPFKLFFSVAFACSMLFSYYRKKYSPDYQSSKTEKTIFLILIVLLLFRFIFF